MNRKARYNGNVWDMGPDLTPEQFRDAVLAPTFPDLANAKYVTTREGDDTIYDFSKSAGAKG